MPQKPFPQTSYTKTPQKIERMNAFRIVCLMLLRNSSVFSGSNGKGADDGGEDEGCHRSTGAEDQCAISAYQHGFDHVGILVL